MRRAFTLIELLVVIGIMGILGTASVGGYRAMRRGMEEKGVMQDVNAFIRAAYQRAQIDRQPTAVFFWNETLRARTGDDNEQLVVGKAVAVRRSGRISKEFGQFLYDEFADLDQTYPTAGDPDSGSSGTANDFYLYPLDNLSRLKSSGDTITRSRVEGLVYEKPLGVTYLTGTAGKTEDSGNVTAYAFKVADEGGVEWQTGMAYGFEFANIELPQGYIFGSAYSESVNNPVYGAGVLTFDVGLNTGNGMSSSGATAGLGSRTSIAVHSLRPGKTGYLESQKVGDSAVPTQNLR